MCEMFFKWYWLPGVAKFQFGGLKIKKTAQAPEKAGMLTSFALTPLILKRSNVKNEFYHQLQGFVKWQNFLGAMPNRNVSLQVIIFGRAKPIYNKTIAIQLTDPWDVCEY